MNTYQETKAYQSYQKLMQDMEIEKLFSQPAISNLTDFQTQYIYNKLGIP